MPIVSNLQLKLSQRRRRAQGGGDAEDDAGDAYSPPAVAELLRTPGRKSYSDVDLPEVTGVPQLPFELHCLELVLQHVCSSLMEQTSELDRVLLPTLDALVLKITM